MAEKVIQMTPAEAEAAEKLRVEMSNISGAQRAAVLMLLLGEQQASEIVKFLNPTEVQSLGGAMVDVSDVSQEAVNAILDEFVATIKKQSSLGLGSTDYVEKVFKRALGDDKAASVLGRILPGQSTKGLEILQWMDARSIADMIKTEHPQVNAIILSVLDHQVAADVLNFLPEETRPEIIQRVASLETVQPSAMQELESIMKLQFSTNTSSKSSSFGGIKAAALIMNSTKTALEASIMGGLEKIDADLMMRLAGQHVHLREPQRGGQQRHSGAHAFSGQQPVDDCHEGCQRRSQSTLLRQHVRACPRHVQRRDGCQRPHALVGCGRSPETNHAFCTQTF
jgi:flagellar motor switch protein FliG